MSAAYENNRQVEISESVQELVDRLHTLHKQLRELANDVEKTELEAGDAGLDRVKFALRDAYVRISQAGSYMVEAHLDLGIPATAYEKPAATE